MRKHFLARTGIEVSEICFGTLTIGPLQKNLSVRQALPILTRAYEKGINFYDTADMYNTYPYLRELLKIDRDLIVCTRSYDYSAEGLNKSLERALRELGRDYVDLYLLHEQESRYTFSGHWEAIEALLKAKEQGKVRAIGISTHRVEAVRDSLDFDELEVLFPLINYRGLGIEDGSQKEMLEAIKLAKSKNKAVFGMKPLGGGNLIADTKKCFDYVLSLLDQELLSSVALGMQSITELDYNIEYFSKRTSNVNAERELSKIRRRLIIDDWCQKCGSCVKKCHQNALYLGKKGIEIDYKKCLTCGYCASVCPVFAIKVI